jgi:hypothetical protein
LYKEKKKQRKEEEGEGEVMKASHLQNNISSTPHESTIIIFNPQKSSKISPILSPLPTPCCNKFKIFSRTTCCCCCCKLRPSVELLVVVAN